MARFLVETALLTHGLKSVTDDEIRRVWPETGVTLAWVDEGEVITGDLEDYLPFRARASEAVRIDCFALESARSGKVTGALTASGTMAVCAGSGIPLAVSCGIGGICDIKGEEVCPDLPALRDLPAALLAASFKDMIDIEASHRWLNENGVRILGAGSDSCTGYIFSGVDVGVERLEVNDVSFRVMPGCLILNKIPEEMRIKDLTLLEKGIRAGKEAEASGGYYHPAANAYFDMMTGGESSRIQLYSLAANAELARKLTER